MRILFAADMEGISGVVDWNHVEPGHPEYERFRRIMTAEVNATIEGALLGGANEIVVSDCHEVGNNILIEELNQHAVVNNGARVDTLLFDGALQVDAAIFVGFHARFHSINALLCHTFTGTISNLWINGQIVGEIGVFAAICGQYEIPVLMISSDLAGCMEAKDWIPNIESVVVKEARGRYAAKCLLPRRAQEMIKNKAEHVVKLFDASNGPLPVKLSSPVRFTVQTFNCAQADRVSLLAGIKRLDSTSVEIEAKDFIGAYQRFKSVIALT
jgi:D-amino peptidase